MSDQPAKPKRSLWRRVLRRSLRVGLIVFIVGGLALAGVLWWANTHRVALANRAFASLAGPVSGTVEGIDVQRSGDFELRGFTLKDKTSGQTVLRLPSATGKFGWAAMASRSVPKLTLHGLEVFLDEKTIASWLNPKPGAADATASGASVAFRLENLDIRDAKLHFTRKDTTTTEVLVNYRADFVALSADGQFSMGNEELTISQSGDVKSLPYGLRRLHAKGRMHDGILDLDELTFEQPSVLLTPELLTTLGINAASDSPPKAVAAQATSPPMLRGVRIGKITVSDFALAANGFNAGNTSGLQLPEVKVLVPSYEAGGFEWKPGGAPRMARQTLHWQNLNLDAPDNDGHVHCEEVRLTLAPWEAGGPVTVEALHLRNPDVHWTPALRKLLMQQGYSSSVPQAPGAPSLAAAPKASPVTIATATISGAKVRIADTDLMSFELETQGGLMIADLILDEEGWHSQAFQTLEVTDGRLVFPAAPDEPAKKPWLELAHGELVMKPDDWNERRRAAKLDLEKLVVRLREGNTPWISPQQPESATAVSAAPSQDVQHPAATRTDAPAENGKPKTENELPWWKRLNFGQLALKEGLADLVLNLPKPVDMRAQVDISTQRVEQGGSQHTVRISDFAAKLPTLSAMPFPVAQAGMIEGVVLLPEIWTMKRFEELHLTGASVDMGEALMKLFEPDKPVVATPPASATPKTDDSDLVGPPYPVPPPPARRIPTQNPWRVGHLSVQDSAITISNLVPGMPAVKFGVSFDVEDTPLLAEDLVDDVAPQRIELHDLKIPSPNGTARYVAELDSIFINFTLEGLMRKEIEGVEIVSPTLFVGEDLFWYVDFYRKYAERGAQPAMQAPQVAANDDDLEVKLADAVLTHEPSVSQASWSVKRLQVFSGKLVLAPKGVPLKGFRTPFPFHIDSEVKRGTLNADLEIPSDTYALPDLNLQFVGMKGRVQFNLPLKQKDNNLVETFEVDSIRWKQIRTGKAFLSVTYDKAGIYAKFGAEAYEGYINGQLNVYTDDSYHWDGWLGGKNVQTHDLTRILCPGYFLMDGRVEATLVAQGSKDELYQADGSFLNHTPGKFTINALNSLINDLPKHWDPLNTQLTKIGLETLRDFEYDHAEMKCRFYGREGNGRLTFTGPLGSRNFDINVYDHRWKGDEPVRVTTSESE